MLLIRKEGFSLDSAKRLVKADEVATVSRAEEIVSAAEAEAARILEEAKTRYEEEKVRGYEKGLADGKAEILQQKLALLGESIRYMESVEAEMGEVVMKALRKCVSDIGDEKLVYEVVHKAMNAVVRNQQQVTVRVSAEMVPVVKARVTDLLKDFPAVNFIEVVEDPRPQGAACVVETATGMVEASIDSQLAAIEQSIRRNFSRTEV